VRNSSLVERQGIDNNRASNTVPKLRIVQQCTLVGEHSIQRRRYLVMGIGADRKANVGISNDKAGEKPAHRKTKVSAAMLISRGLVGT
jgi:hypothetical protein